MEILSWKVKGIAIKSGIVTEANTLYTKEVLKKIGKVENIPLTDGVGEDAKIIGNATVEYVAGDLVSSAFVDNDEMIKGKVCPTFEVGKMTEKNGIHFAEDIKLISIGLAAFHSQDKHIPPYERTCLLKPKTLPKEEWEEVEK